MGNINIKSIFFLVFIFFNSLTYAGAWLQKAGSIFFSLDYRFLYATKFHDDAGENISIPRLNDIAINIFGEAGITDDISVILNAPVYKILSAEGFSENDTEQKGPGDLTFGIKVHLKQIDKTVISGKLILGIPVGKTDLFLPLGDGEFNQALGLSVGHSLYPLPAYLNSNLSFNKRSEGYSDEFYYSVEGGYKLVSKLLVNVIIHGLQPLRNGDGNEKGGYAKIFADNQQYIALKTGIFYNINDKFGLSGTFETGLSARNIQSAPVFSFGVFTKL